jgi:hypothetical protein
MLGDDTPRGGMDAHIGHRIEPVLELCIEVLEIAELAAEEEVLTHVTERPLDFALGLGAIRAARLGQEAVMASEVEQCAIILNPAVDCDSTAGFAASYNHNEQLRPVRDAAAGRVGGPSDNV